MTKLPTPEEIRLQYPITEKIARVKAQRDQEIKDIFTGKSDRFLVIIGPCSADNEDSVCDYVGRLAKVQDQVGDRLLHDHDIYAINREPPARVTKAFSISRTLRKTDVLAGLVAIRNCICAPLRRPDSPPQMRCSIRKTGVTFLISLSYVAIEPFRGEPSTVWWSAAWISPQE